MAAAEQCALVLSGQGKDESVYQPAEVRRFLAALRVPLFVWSLDNPRESASAAAWGGAEDFSARNALAPAMAKIRAELESQRVVLVDGRHLPQSIGLGPAATGVALVGAER